MPKISLLTEAQLRQCVVLDHTIVDVINAAFASLVTQPVVMPPVLSMDLPSVNGEVDVKTAYIPGVETFAIKISPGFFSNPSKGLPSLNGLMVAFDAQTGLVKAVLLDNGYLTDIRTAAAGAVAARHLAPKQVKSIGVMGAGVQAGLQVKAALLERDAQQVLVWGRNVLKAEQFAKEQSRQTGKPFSVVEDPQKLVQQAELVITTTPAREPIIQASWLHPKLHITAMGSDSAEKNELDPNILMQANQLIVDRKAQSIERGEMRSAIKVGVMDENNAQVAELGELCAGRIQGRQTEDGITVCDLTGTGIQDTAIANYAQQVAMAKKLGTMVEA